MGTSHWAAMAWDTVVPPVVTSILTTRTMYVITPMVTRKATTESTSLARVTSRPSRNAPSSAP